MIVQDSKGILYSLFGEQHSYEKLKEYLSVLG